MLSVVEMLACPSCSCAIFTGTFKSDMSGRVDVAGGLERTFEDRLSNRQRASFEVKRDPPKRQ
jgi:hypothetical protein